MSVPIDEGTYQAIYNGDGCNPQSITLYAGLQCTANTPISAGTLTISIYPQPTATLNLSPNGCTVTATPDCPNFSIVGANSQTSSTNGDNSAVSFTVQNDDFSSCTNTINGNFNCVIVQNCPTVSVPAAATEDFCATANSIDFNTIENNVVYDDPDNQVPADPFAWYSDAALSVPIDEGTYQAIYSGDGCNPQTITLYAGLQCTGNTPIAAGTLTISIYPPFSNSLVTAVDGVCGVPPTLTSTCPHYVITPSADVPTDVLAGQSGTANFTVTYDDDAGLNCFSQNVAVNYACPSENCPTASQAVRTANICQTTNVNLSNYENLIIISDPDQQIPVNDTVRWYQNSVLTQEISDPLNFFLNYNGNGCEIDTVSVYAGVQCTNSSPIPSDIWTFYVFPSPTAANWTETQGNCTPPSLTSNCDNYVIEALTPVPVTVAAGENSSVTYAVSYVYDFGGGAVFTCDTVSVTVPYSCPAASCPTATVQSLTAQICENTGNVDLTIYNSQMVFSDPQNQIPANDTIRWYSNAALSNEIVNDAAYNLLYDKNGCEIDTLSVYAGLQCAGSSPILAATLTYYIAPDVDNDLLTITEGNCAPPSVSSSCDNYGIQAISSVPVSVAAGESGTVSYSVYFESSGAVVFNCDTIQVDVNYSCPAAPCPTIDALVFPSDSVACSGESITVNMVLDTPTGALTPDSVRWLNAQGQLLSNTLTLSWTETVSGCDPLILPLTAELYCEGAVVPSDVLTTQMVFFPIPQD
ncbi:MAG: hypothetical protein IPL35_14515 [Sphingobacteriales bacterium]|nr:hypothetical protein [Sphingobacteriales bacterium]